MKRFGFVVAIVTAFFVVTQTGCNPPRKSQSEKGGIWAVYDKECQKCHKARGSPGLVGHMIFKIPDFTNATWQDNVSDTRLIISVANGKKKMPGYKGKIPDVEIVDLIKVCVRSFYPKEDQ